MLGLLSNPYGYGVVVDLRDGNVTERRQDMPVEDGSIASPGRLTVSAQRREPGFGEFGDGLF